MLRSLSVWLRRFAVARRGNVAVLYALALVPVTVAAGGGLDYARSVVVKSSMGEALDAAALAVAQSKGLTTAQMQALAQQYFNANYHQSADFGTPVAVTVTKSGQVISVTTSCAMPTTMLQIAGMSSWTINAASTVTFGQTKLWVALVLDNTGSMSDSDKSGLSKMTALKSASHSLLTMLQGAGTNAGDVQVAIIPFARNVNIGTSYANASWISFADFTAAPSTPSNTVGPGSWCPWSDNTDGFHCQSGPGNGSQATNQIPSWGGYSGYICPSATTTGHYWNGCFNSVSQSGGKYKHTWIPNDTDSWGGCVTDRGKTLKPNGPDYDTNADTPAQTPPKSVMVAENSPSCPIATILPLGYNWTTLSNKIDAMQPNGSTNQTIGLVWGWHALTQGAPLNPPALPSDTQRVVILLSDGLNTQDRWYGNGYQQNDDVDDRMALACSSAKAAGLTIYAVFVDINGAQGNSSTLQACASDASKYYDLTSSSQIQSAFTDIAQQITNLRVTQ